MKSDGLPTDLSEFPYSNGPFPLKKNFHGQKNFQKYHCLIKGLIKNGLLLLFTFYSNTTNSDKNTLFGTFLIKSDKKSKDYKRMV